MPEPEASRDRSPTDNDHGTGSNAFLVVGTETADANLQALPTATHEGYARLLVAPTTGFNDLAEEVSEARGDVAMVADFGAGTVSGEVTNMKGRVTQTEDPTRSGTPFDGTLMMEEAAINGNGSTGAITADARLDEKIGTVDPGSTCSGTFFGPGGEEVGGGINVTGTGAEDCLGYLGYGHWRRWRQ